MDSRGRGNDIVLGGNGVQDLAKPSPRRQQVALLAAADDR
jgi:hypothetical protein